MDLRAGSVMSPLLNLLRIYLLKDPKMTTIEDWLMTFKDIKGAAKKSPKIQDWKSMKALAKAFVEANQ